MRFIHSRLSKAWLLLLSLGLAQVAAAQDAGTEPVKTVQSSTNQVAIMMLIIAVVLAFVIWSLGQVLFGLGRQAIAKHRSDKALALVMLLGLSLIGLPSHAQDAATEAVKVVPNYGGLSETTFWVFISVIVTEVIVIAFLMFSIRRIQYELLPENMKVKARKANWWDNLDKKFFTKAVPVEKEADVLLDHDYDGIHELDNALPPWWKYGFYITIGVAFVYLLNYHVLGYGMNPTQEYETEMTRAQADLDLYASKQVDKVDESNVKMPDAAGIAKGKEIFETTCFACHGKLGEGTVGPNLTDDYWLHKGSITDIYHSIKTGYPDKGMQSWAKNFSPKEIADLAGFITTLKGTNPPNAKAPQGDLYTSAPAAATDSTKAATPAAADSVTVAGKK
jgi:cytochrome c oxidase cbb3-type subunit 3